MSNSSGLPPGVERTVLTVGSFDGVHRGHQDVLARVVARARDRGTSGLLLTFDPHPLEIVNPVAAPPLLTVGDEKLEVLAESAIDYVAVLPFTRELASWPAERFVDEILVRRYRVAHLLMGADHGFGRNREGNVDVLRQLGESRDFSVEVLQAVNSGGGQPISSTRIRRAIAGGDLGQAYDALGRPYSVSGRVVHGEKRGRLLGFPTINVPLLSPRKLLPPMGVYAATVQTSAGPYGAMLNLGPRPTFGDETISIEANLLDADVDLYGAHVRIDFRARIRDTMRFDSAEELMAQLTKDAQSARELIQG